MFLDGVRGEAVDWWTRTRGCRLFFVDYFLSTGRLVVDWCLGTGFLAAFATGRLLSGAVSAALFAFLCRAHFDCLAFVQPEGNV